jgi:hypothetical protein
MTIEATQIKDIELKIMASLNEAKRESQISDGPWMRGLVSGLTRALDFIHLSQMEAHAVSEAQK